MVRKLLRAAVISTVLCTSIANAQSSDPGVFSAEGSGIVVPAKSWDVSAVSENQIETVHFIEGQMVEKGDLLVTFDQVFKQWDARIAELDHIQAISDLELATAELSRLEKLSATSVPEVQIIEARARVKSAEAHVEITDLNAQRAKALSDLQLIYAPFDGQMSAPRFRDNANVIAESPEIGTLFQLDPIHVRVEGAFDRHEERILAGDTHDSVIERLVLVLELPGGNTFPHQGKLVSTPFEFDPETGIGYSIAEFPNPELLLRPGMKVRVTSYEKSN